MLINGFTIIPSEEVEAGIYIYANSNNCTVMDSVIANFSEAVSYYRNWYGLLLEGSWNCRILGNAFVNDGLMVSYSYGNVVENNVVNGKPLVYLENRSNVAVDNAGQAILVNCTGIRVENLDLSNTTIGVELWETNNTTITGNNITNNYYGNYLYESSNSSISGNNITNNSLGNYLYVSASSSISGNNITNNRLGIYSEGYARDGDDKNIVHGNNIAHNYYGIYSYRYDGDGNNVIHGNNIANNDFGIFCYHSMGDGNNIAIAYGNNIKYNSYGVYCSKSINNTFYHNNFIDNAYYQAYPAGSVQIWDNGCEGNYWSNYAGTDSDGDGIGDTAYSIDPNNRDKYPLMSPYIVGDINHDGTVNLNDLLLMDNAYGTRPEDSNWNCHCDIARPEENPDGLIDIYDLATVGKNYGKTAEP